MKIRAILIDDERKSLAILKNKLERYGSDIEIIAESQDPQEGIELINKLKPQLVFLDVAMPVISGFDLLAQFENPDFEVIFVTAFDNYAIEAIKHCAIGYLVKPVDNDELKEVIARASENIKNKNALQKNNTLIENLGVQNFQHKKIIIPTQEGLEFVKIEEIIRCEGKDGYTELTFVNRKSFLSSYSIGRFEKLLENKEFYLIHKSHLINLNHIDKYKNEGYIELTNKDSVPVSRGRRVAFLEYLKG